jgi:hypothetical protein
MQSIDYTRTNIIIFPTYGGHCTVFVNMAKQEAVVKWGQVAANIQRFKEWATFLTLKNLSCAKLGNMITRTLGYTLRQSKDTSIMHSHMVLLLHTFFTCPWSEVCGNRIRLLLIRKKSLLNNEKHTIKHSSLHHGMKDCRWKLWTMFYAKMQ